MLSIHGLRWTSALLVQCVFGILLLVFLPFLVTRSIGGPMDKLMPGTDATLFAAVKTYLHFHRCIPLTVTSS